MSNQITVWQCISTHSPISYNDLFSIQCHLQLISSVKGLYSTGHMRPKIIWWCIVCVYSLLPVLCIHNYCVYSCSQEEGPCWIWTVPPAPLSGQASAQMYLHLLQEEASKRVTRYVPLATAYPVMLTGKKSICLMWFFSLSPLKRKSPL